MQGPSTVDSGVQGHLFAPAESVPPIPDQLPRGGMGWDTLREFMAKKLMNEQGFFSSRNLEAIKLGEKEKAKVGKLLAMQLQVGSVSFTLRELLSAAVKGNPGAAVCLGEEIASFVFAETGEAIAREFFPAAPLKKRQGGVVPLLISGDFSKRVEDFLKSKAPNEQKWRSNIEGVFAQFSGKGKFTFLLIKEREWRSDGLRIEIDPLNDNSNLMLRAGAGYLDVALGQFFFNVAGGPLFINKEDGWVKRRVFEARRGILLAGEEPPEPMAGQESSERAYTMVRVIQKISLGELPIALSTLFNCALLVDEEELVIKLWNSASLLDPRLAKPKAGKGSLELFGLMRELVVRKEVPFKEVAALVSIAACLQTLRGRGAGSLAFSGRSVLLALHLVEGGSLLVPFDFKEALQKTETLLARGHPETLSLLNGLLRKYELPTAHYCVKGELPEVAESTIVRLLRNKQQYHWLALHLLEAASPVVSWQLLDAALASPLGEPLFTALASHLDRCKNPAAAAFRALTSKHPKFGEMLNNWFASPMEGMDTLAYKRLWPLVKERLQANFATDEGGCFLLGHLGRSGSRHFASLLWELLKTKLPQTRLKYLQAALVDHGGDLERLGIDAAGLQRLGKEVSSLKKERGFKDEALELEQYLPAKPAAPAAPEANDDEESSAQPPKTTKPVKQPPPPREEHPCISLLNQFEGSPQEEWPSLCRKALEVVAKSGAAPEAAPLVMKLEGWSGRLLKMKDDGLIVELFSLFLERRQAHPLPRGEAAALAAKVVGSALPDEEKLSLLCSPLCKKAWAGEEIPGLEPFYNRLPEEAAGQLLLAITKEGVRWPERVISRIKYLLEEGAYDEANLLIERMEGNKEAPLRQLRFMLLSSPGKRNGARLLRWVEEGLIDKDEKCCALALAIASEVVMEQTLKQKNIELLLAFFERGLIADRSLLLYFSLLLRNAKEKSSLLRIIPLLKGMYEGLSGRERFNVGIELLWHTLEEPSLVPLGELLHELLPLFLSILEEQGLSSVDLHTVLLLIVTLFDTLEEGDETEKEVLATLGKSVPAIAKLCSSASEEELPLFGQLFCLLASLPDEKAIDLPLADWFPQLIEKKAFSYGLTDEETTDLYGWLFAMHRMSLGGARCQEFFSMARPLLNPKQIAFWLSESFKLDCCRVLKGAAQEERAALYQRWFTLVPEIIADEEARDSHVENLFDLLFSLENYKELAEMLAQEFIRAISYGQYSLSVSEGVWELRPQGEARGMEAELRKQLLFIAISQCKYIIVELGNSSPKKLEALTYYLLDTIKVMMQSGFSQDEELKVVVELALYGLIMYDEPSHEKNPRMASLLLDCRKAGIIAAAGEVENAKEPTMALERYYRVNLLSSWGTVAIPQALLSSVVSNPAASNLKALVESLIVWDNPQTLGCAFQIVLAAYKSIYSSSDYEEPCALLRKIAKAAREQRKVVNLAVNGAEGVPLPFIATLVELAVKAYNKGNGAIFAEQTKDGYARDSLVFTDLGDLCLEHYWESQNISFGQRWWLLNGALQAYSHIGFTTNKFAPDHGFLGSFEKMNALIVAIIDLRSKEEAPPPDKEPLQWLPSILMKHSHEKNRTKKALIGELEGLALRVEPTSGRKKQLFTKDSVVAGMKIDEEIDFAWFECVELAILELDKLQIAAAKKCMVEIAVSAIKRSVFVDIPQERVISLLRRAIIAIIDIRSKEKSPQPDEDPLQWLPIILNSREKTRTKTIKLEDLKQQAPYHELKGKLNDEQFLKSIVASEIKAEQEIDFAWFECVEWVILELDKLQIAEAKQYIVDIVGAAVKNSVFIGIPQERVKPLFQLAGECRRSCQKMGESSS